MPSGNFTRERPSKHGLCGHKLYKLWDQLKQGVSNRRSSRWNSIGLKGIKFYKVWNDSFIEFYNWAISNGWKENQRLQRHDLEKDFTPENCFFVETKTRNYRMNFNKRESSVRGVY